MRILVVVNNHNSIGVVNFCLNLKQLEKDIEVIAVCDARNHHIHGDFFKQNGVPCNVFELDDEANKGMLLIKDVRKMELQSHRDGQQGKTASPLQAIKSIISGLIFSSSLFYYVREKLIRTRMKKHQANALKLLEQAKIDVVFSLSDRSHDYVEGAVLWAAKKKYIKVILPYIAQFDIDASLQYRVDENGKPHPGLAPFRPPSVYKTLSYFKFKEQVHKGFFFQEPYMLTASKKSGILSTYPWWVGNGNSDIVCVDSQYTAKKYRGHRVDAQKITVVGHIAYDGVYKSCQNKVAIKASLTEKYALHSDKKLIVLSMPQYAEQGYISWDAHWNEINTMLKALSETDVNVIVSIHPRSDTSQYQYIEEQYHCRIADEPLLDIIGAADLFLASNSTTFSWAVLCGIPSIALMSPVRFLYEHLTTVVPVYDSAQLTDKICDILNQATISFDRDWALLSKNDVFDGRFNERFLQLLHSVCAENQNKCSMSN